MCNDQKPAAAHKYPDLTEQLQTKTSDKKCDNDNFFLKRYENVGTNVQTHSYNLNFYTFWEILETSISFIGILHYKELVVFANENIKSANCIHARQNPTPWSSLSALYSLSSKNNDNVYETTAEKINKKAKNRVIQKKNNNQEVHGNSGGAEETIAS